MTINIAKSAQQDLLEGFAFYEKQKEGLGDYFLNILFSDIDELLDTAGMYPLFFNYHRKLSRTFPFAIYYKVRDEMIYIYAILDCRRKPSWIRQKIERLS